MGAIPFTPISPAAQRAVAGAAPGFGQRRCAETKAETVVQLPERPDLSVLSEAIPLFYVGRNRHGFWVVRDADGRSGGVFLWQRSARRFAGRQSASSGCATMFLNETLELDLENQGSRLVPILTALLEFVGHRAPGVASLVGMMRTEWRKLCAEIWRAVAGARRNRDALERELFRGQYRLSSKNDDDLPVP